MNNTPTGYENQVDDLLSEWFYCEDCEDDNKGTYCKNCKLLETD